MYLQCISFLHTDMTKIVEILPRVRQGPTYLTVNIMAADRLTTQGARTPATMILSILSRNNSVLAREGFLISATEMDIDHTRCYLSGVLYYHRSALIPPWISTYINFKAWDATTYLFPNVNGAAVESPECINKFIPHFNGQVITYSCQDCRVHPKETIFKIIGPSVQCRVQWSRL